MNCATSSVRGEQNCRSGELWCGPQFIDGTSLGGVALLLMMQPVIELCPCGWE